MRFPEDKIKEAILHPDPEIRRRATRYFSNSYSPDPSIMAQVIKAVQTLWQAGCLPPDRVVERPAADRARASTG